MNLKQKKKISHIGTLISRAAIFIPEPLPHKDIQTGVPPEEKVEQEPTISFFQNEGKAD